MAMQDQSIGGYGNLSRSQFAAGHQEQPQSRAPRPRGIALIVALQVCIGVLSIVAGTGVFVISHLPQSPSWGVFQPLTVALPIVIIALGVAAIVVGSGLWRGRAWAWVLTFVLELVGALGGIEYIAFHSFAPGKLIELGIAVVILVYLTRPHVQAYFGFGQ